MKVTVEFKGGKELAAMLAQLPMGVGVRVRIDALKKAAEPMRSQAERLAPRSQLSKPHLADNIIVQQVTRVGSVEGGRSSQTEGDEAWVAVGPHKNFFYGIYQEYGTVHQHARPFMRPAFDAGASAALPILSDELWKALVQTLSVAA